MTGTSPGGRLFLALHLAALLVGVALVASVLAGHFIERRERVASDIDDLHRIDDIDRRTATLVRQIAGRGNPFLSAGDERLGSADLQAILQDLARSGGTSFLSVRGVPAPRRPDLRLVAAKLEFEGPPERVAAVVKSVESHVPLLWIDAAAIRDTGNGQEPGAILHAELQVQAALAAGRPEAEPLRPPGESLDVGGLRP